MSTAFVLAPFQLLRSATPDPVYLVMFGESAVLGVAHSVLIPMSMQFVFNGADIMCPGLTSAGATIEDEADEGAVVAIYAEGKEHALAVGLTTMSTEDSLPGSCHHEHRVTEVFTIEREKCTDWKRSRC